MAAVYRYTFAPRVPLDEVAATILLAVWGAEALHGARAKLDAGHALDRVNRVCVVDARTAAGRDLNALFAGYLAREFGPTAFRAERVPTRPRRRAGAAR
jgi:hypothetical protein